MRQRVAAIKKTFKWTAVPIEAAEPKSWHELQQDVRRILREAGLATRIDFPVTTARGDVDVDVYAVDSDSALPNVVIVECKYWRTRVTKAVVHSVRSVVADAGANTGLVVSRVGFQPGAISAAKYTNVRLLTWDAFQRQFVARWFVNHMLPRVLDEAERLIEYTEPFNSRITRKFLGLSDEQKDAVRKLEAKYRGLAATGMVFRLAGNRPPMIPMRDLSPFTTVGVPDDVLDATSLRLLLSLLTRRYRRATAAFDAAFGGRA